MWSAHVRRYLSALWLSSALLHMLSGYVAAAERPRLIVLTDIGGDPDDQQSMIRLMLYSNEFEIEGLIATAMTGPVKSTPEVVKPELIREIIDAYAQVRDNLLLHAPGYPPASQLRDCVKTGNPKRGVGSLGDGKDTVGSRWIIQVVDRPDPRPVNVSIWGGSTDLAQALWRVRDDRTPAELARFVSKLRVYAISHQDDTGPWIIANFPNLFYVLGKPPDGADRREAVYRGMYLGGDESLTSRAWIDKHVRTGHGPLGALYPDKTWTAPNPHGALKEGDTPSWFFFLPIGLSDPEHPEYGGWGGRFQHAGNRLYRDAKDAVGTVTHVRAAVWRWRPAFQADFQARLDWCVKPKAAANHPPQAVINGDRSDKVILLAQRPGAVVPLDAAGSNDPDGNTLFYRWWVYREAGTFDGPIEIQDAEKIAARLTMPTNAGGKTIHVILEVTDDGTPALTRYRRVVLVANER